MAHTAKVKNPAAVALGKLGASKGGKARAAKLTKAQRSEAAQKAANARWSKRWEGLMASNPGYLDVEASI
jgi:hypothetical protein